MRRSDRLSEIIEIVQDGRLHLADDIAERLEVSVHTIYRDIDTLVASGFPIDGERGVGYMLREPAFLPPMNLSLTELEALHLGMAVVSEAADSELQTAAASLTSKIDKVATANGTAPKNWGFGVYPFAQAKIGFEHMPRIRTAIRNKEKLEIAYLSLSDETSTIRVAATQQRTGKAPSHSNGKWLEQAPGTVSENDRTTFDARGARAIILISNGPPAAA